MKLEEGTFSCPIYHKPVDLNRDRNDDEDGKVMHEDC